MLMTSDDILKPFWHGEKEILIGHVGENLVSIIIRFIDSSPIKPSFKFKNHFYSEWFVSSCVSDGEHTLEYLVLLILISNQILLFQCRSSLKIKNYNYSLVDLKLHSIILRMTFLDILCI